MAENETELYAAFKAQYAWRSVPGSGLASQLADTRRPWRSYAAVKLWKTL